jgi:mannosyl-oligosaccharide alpha-1,2-mannosidase
MLPFHTREPPSPAKRPSLLSPRSLKLLTSKPALRWLSYLFALLVTVWLFAPYILPERDPITFPSEMTPAPEVLSARAQQVQDAYVHAYSGYKKHAWTFDELKPVTGGSVNK